MLSCACCGSTVLLAKKAGEHRYCNEQCAAIGPIHQVARTIPEEHTRLEAMKIHRSTCPTCKQGNGPVDLHYAHTIVSFLLATQWRSKAMLCCKRCAAKTQAIALLQSAVAGWWGFPWGILGTPITLLRNMIGLAGKTGKSGPSRDLLRHVRSTLAANKIWHEREERLAGSIQAVESARSALPAK